MEIIRHNIGDKVIALTNPKNEHCQPRVKGQIYIVKDVSYCQKCGTQTINIGYKMNHHYRKRSCTICKNISNINDVLAWTHSELFAKVDNATLENAIAEENYELAAIVRDNLLQPKET